MEFETRPLGQEDIEESIRLSEFAFQYKLSEEDRAARVRDASPDETIGCFVQGQLAAKATFLTLEVYLQGVAFAMGGVGGVATWPEYRRGGMVAHLLRQGLRQMRERRQLVSMLQPFSYGFYRRYGWELTHDRTTIELDVTQLPRWQADGWTLEQTTELSRLAPIYDAHARRFDGMLRRSPEWWAKRFKRARNPHMTVCVDGQGRDRGYLVYEVKDSVFEAIEFVALDQGARRALWKHVANHDSMAQTYRLIAEPGQALALELDNPRFKREVAPQFMGRIVDVEAFLARYPLAWPAQSELWLELQDEHAPWNTGCFRIGSGGVERVAPLQPQTDDVMQTSVSCDIQTLSAMIFGYARPACLAEIGRLDGRPAAIAAWECAIPRGKPLLLDGF